MTDAKSITNERLGRLIEDSASEIYLFSAEDFTFTLVNRGARENLGYSMDELRVRTPWDIKPVFGRDAFVEMVRPLIIGDTNRLDFETVHERKDGSHYHVVVRLQLLRSDGEAVFYAAIEDATHRKKMEAAFQQASARLDAILSNTTMAVLMMDDRQHCVFMNKAAEQLTGFTLAEMQGRTLHDVIHHTYPDGRPFPIDECAIDRAFPENNQVQGEDVFVHKDGTFYPVGFTASPMKDEDGQTIGTIVEARNIAEELEARATLADINKTLERRVEESIVEREKVEEQLRQSQKMEAVGQLTGGIAHDFNNLLTIVSGNIDIARRGLGEDADPRVSRAIANAIKGADRAATLTQRLLAFSRRQPLQPCVTDINRLLTGMSDLLNRALGETIDFQIVAGAGLWRIEVDPNQLENAILNLAVNARDAMSYGGKLTIETTNAHIDEAYAATQQEVVAGQYVQVSITDTGAGMSPDVITKAFDPFFSTKEVGKGTGLGLSQVYGFVKQSGGHVRIYSELGEGTTIKLYFPRIAPAMALAEEENALTLAPALEGQETILVVEDDDDVRMFTVESLRELGYRVLEAHDGPSALRLLERQEEPVRLLFTDVVMPIMSGRELADTAKEAYPDLQILFTTGYARNAIVHAGRLDAGVALLTKPFTREALSSKVRDVLDKPVAHRALLIFPTEDGSVHAGNLLSSLGFDIGSVGSAREALGKLRSAGGRFDVAILSDALPVGNLGPVINELQAVRNDLPIVVLHSAEVSDLQAEMAGNPCVGFVSSTSPATVIRVELEKLRVRCAGS